MQKSHNERPGRVKPTVDSLLTEKEKNEDCLDRRRSVSLQSFNIPFRLSQIEVHARIKDRIEIQRVLLLECDGRF